jgi:hypothetical protein
VQNRFVGIEHLAGEELEELRRKKRGAGPKRRKQRGPPNRSVCSARCRQGGVTAKVAPWLQHTIRVTDNETVAMSGRLLLTALGAHP